MLNCNVIAIDLAKNLFQVCKTQSNGKVIYNKTISRAKLKELLIKEQQSLVAMESCGGTHYWAQFAKQAGHQIKAINARQVKAFRQGQKTDANDALAILVAARQPHIKGSRLLSVQEQCLQGIECMRDLLVKQKVSLGNQLSALLLEFGYPIAQGDTKLTQAIPEILEDAENSLTGAFRFTINRVYQRFTEAVEEVKLIEKQLHEVIKEDQTCIRLQALEGVGPVCAILIKIALGNTTHFKNGREAAACFGLTPVQHSSGGKQKIGSISKVIGNKKLRSALYKGALAVVSQLEKREVRSQKDIWLKELSVRRGKKVAAIALANKTIRTAFAMQKHNKDYQPQLLVA